MVTRRQFLRWSAVLGASLTAPWMLRPVQASVRGRSLTVRLSGSLDAPAIPKYDMPLIIPPAMPRTGTVGEDIQYFEIAVRQFQQQILPPSLPQTTVWSYGSANHPDSFNYPAFTIEAKYNEPVRVKWINDLIDANGNYLPHLLPVDQTLHWVNPPGGTTMRDRHGTDQAPYTGPVPIITHVHGAHVSEESDGYPEAWYLPNANNIPDGYATVGTFYEPFQAEFANKYGGDWAPGAATFQYPNDQRATTLWYHDHALGMTRLNVYAGPAGFYLLRGGPDDVVRDINGDPAILPGPAPALGDAAGKSHYEIPIVIQDRSFNEDGSLFYPDNRAFFEELDPSQLQIPFRPDEACGGLLSDVSPIWNPEFFGSTIVVNGRTWPYLEVEQRRYRFRFLNGCNSRFLILKFDNELPLWQIGADGGFLAAPVQLDQLLMGPAERADVIVDFTNVAAGTEIILLNLGPDEPFGGGEPDADFPAADPQTTGQVMQFRVVATSGPDPSTPPDQLVLPALVALGPVDNTRKLSLNEEESKSVRVITAGDGSVVLACDDSSGEPFGPTAAELGTLTPDGSGRPLGWDEDMTENPVVGTTEVWEIYNFTADAHPIHIHLVQFQIVNRQALVTDDEGMSVQPAQLSGGPRQPETWESGFKDTVIAYPGEVTRVKARFDYAGLYVWHCHILEHEDNEMMRPYRIVPRELPETGGEGISPAAAVAGLGGLAIAGGMGLEMLSRRARQDT